MVNELDIAPHSPSTWEIIVRTLIGLIVWFIIAITVFFILILIGSMFEIALKNSASTTTVTVNPLLGFILMIIAFFGSVMGTIIVTWLYSLLLSNKYYDFGKMFKIVLSTNIIIFFLFAPIYILFYNRIETLFVILAFHIMFSVFIASSWVEFITNPNYSTVHIVWTTIWLSLSILIFAIVYKSIDLNSWNSSVITLLLSLPSILAYTVIPFAHSIWEKVYYRFYEVWNNFFYIPSINEVMVDEEEDEESINVE